MNRKNSAREDRDRFGSGTPGDQGTYSVVGEQPDGGGAGLGAQVKSGTGSERDIAESQPKPPREDQL